MDATSSLISAWNVLIQQLACVFTRPTARVWEQIVLGWVLHRGPATVTGMIRTLGALALRHWTVYHKFFYRASWSLSELSARLLRGVVWPLIVDSDRRDPRTGKPIVDLHIDDTTAGRYGKHVAHAGWFKDASCNGPAYKGTVIHWAHNWIVGAVTLRLPAWPLLRWALPVLFALYRKRPDCNATHPFQTRQQIAAAMVCQAAEALPEVLWRVCVDGQYATRDMVAGLPGGANMVSRIRSDAALHELPSGRRRKGCRRGPVPKKGQRLPPLKELAQQSNGWKTITVCHQGRPVKRKVLSLVCLWYHVCRGRPVRVVIVRDPKGRQKDDYFFCTDSSADEQQIAQRATDRWGIEEAIQEAKQQLGFEKTRGWCSKTVNRQAPLAMALVTLIKAWYAHAALRAPRLLPKGTPWLPDKQRPTFSDMLSALRSTLWHYRISRNSTVTYQVRKFLAAVNYSLCAAA
jgi:hypothetical protein